MTVRYIMGHALFAATGLGKALPDSLRPALALPLVYSDAADGFDHGAGAAIDLGAALEMPALTATMDLRHRFDTGLDVEPGTHAGLGAEYRPFPYLPLRGGVAIISGGYRAATGFGVEHGPTEFGIAAAHARGAMGHFAALTASPTFRSN